MSKIPRSGQSWKSRKKRKALKWLKNITPTFKNLWKKIKKAGVVKNILLAAVALFLLGTIAFLALFAFLSRDLPDPNSLTMREVPQSTKIYDRSGEHLLYEISGDEKRTLVMLEDIPEHLVNATITAEDRKFYDHGGISLKGIFRAVFSNVASLDPTGQGASTITQQLVKNAILTSEKTYTRKIKEIILSLALERRYTKDEILQLYLNEIAYGSTNYGVQSASQSYFDKDVQDLTLVESATIAALPKAPTTFLNDPERLRERRDWILDGMAELDYITEEERDEAKAQETEITLSIANIEAPHFVLWVKELLEQEYGQRTVEQGGLTVVTSIDFDKQQIAEEAVVNNRDARAETYGFNNSGLVAMDPNNGQILAMVGSTDYFDDEIDGQVNVTLRPLQPGSSFKPIVYTAGFERGYTPNSILWDVETDFATATGPYHPRNYDLSQHGPVTIRKALQGSLNIPAVKMLALVGVDAGLDFAERLHYSTFTDRSNFGLAIVLGGAEVKLLDHTAAYATLANEGVYHEPVPILKVEDTNGNVLEEWQENEGERVVEENIARMTTNVLSYDGARAYAFGTGSLLTLPGRPVATKTGTTNDYNDAWTMGYTPQLVAGVWTGNTDGTEMARGSGGSSVAAPIWNEFMRRALENEPVESFNAPSIPITGKSILDGQIPSETITIDTASGKLATDRTPERFRETKTCGEFHTILYFVNPANPLGDQPTNPEDNPMFSNWESAVQSYLEAQRQKAEESGEAALESCEIPTEEDDVHVPANQPEVDIRSPGRNDEVGRSFGVELRASAPRGISRVEYFIDDKLILLDFDSTGTFVALPSWVGTGNHQLKIVAYDDVDNADEDSVQINVTEEGFVNGLTITNPFSQQTIETGDGQYQIVVEATGTSRDLTSLTVTIQNTWTGERNTLAESATPSSVNTFTWTIPEPAQYMILASGVTQEGTRVDASPVVVTVKEPPQSEKENEEEDDPFSLVQIPESDTEDEGEPEPDTIVVPE